MDKLSRRDFLRLVTSGTAAAMVGGCARNILPERALTKRPNILFIFTDDQRFDTINALGNADIVTPNMDSLVSAGTTFTHACIMGSMSGAVCMPSRAMLMSGRTLFHAPHNLKNTVTFPQIFHEAGYTTFGTGKWHNSPESFARSFTCGAHIFFGGMSNHLKVPANDYDPTGKYPKEKRYTTQKFSSELFTDATIKFLHEYEENKPFLAYIPYTAPHDPRMAPDEYKRVYDPQNISLPQNFMPEHPFDNGEMKIRDEKLAPWPRTPEIAKQHIADYYSMITHLDNQIGRILEALKETGHAENTIIIFAGDNGLAVGQHGLMGKQNLYDHSIRVPLVITGPGIPKGKRTDTLCYLLDLFPTLCEMVGLPIPGSVEGQSLMPAIMGGSKVRDNLFFAYKGIQRAVRDEKYKLIEYSVEGTQTTQLFDLQNDPWEVNNLSADPNNADQLNRLRREMLNWQREIDDPMLKDL